MERQALRDAVRSYNAEGVAGLFDRPKGHRAEWHRAEWHRAEWLTAAEQATLAAAVFKGPDPTGDGVCTWTCEALAVWIASKFGKTIHPHSVGRTLGRLGLSRQKARPVHPKTESKA
jgi:transposase